MIASAESALPIGIALPLALLLVLANALFVAAEFALVRVRVSRLRHRAEAGQRVAARALYLAENLDETLSVCQVGITLASLGLGWLGEPAFAHIFTKLFSPAEPWLGAATLTVSIGSAFFLITFLHVVLGELVPKTIAITIAEPVAIATALPMRAFWIASWPLVAFLNGAARIFLRPMRLGDAEEDAHGIDEIRGLLAHSVRKGRIKLADADLIRNTMRFSRRKAQEVMVPRARVAALDAAAGRDEVLAFALDEGYSRYPVYDGDLDQILGLVHVKDLLGALRTDPSRFDLRALVRPIVIVPETLPIETLLRRFQREGAHMAVAADEYGGAAGIVTLEDVIEELVGEVRDEFDQEELDPVRRRPGGGYLLDALLPLDVAAGLVDDPPEPPEGVTSVAGLIQERLGRLPETGDGVPYGAEHELIAAEVDRTHVVRVELVPRSASDGAPGPAESRDGPPPG